MKFLAKTVYTKEQQAATYTIQQEQQAATYDIDLITNLQYIPGNE
jgi:hypothetical protein